MMIHGCSPSCGAVDMGRLLGTEWVQDRLCEVYEDSQSSDPHAQRVDWQFPLLTKQDLEDMDDLQDGGDQEVQQLQDEELVSFGCC
jgi:hypothetical protein